MTSSVQLTGNAIQRILNGEEITRPILQILAYKAVQADGENQFRFRFIMSDGEFSHQCCIMIGEELISRIEKGEFERYTIIQLNQYICNTVNDRKVLIMTEPVVVKPGSVVGQKIGTPVSAAAVMAQNSAAAPVKKEYPMAPENHPYLQQTAPVVPKPVMKSNVSSTFGQGTNRMGSGPASPGSKRPNGGNNNSGVGGYGADAKRRFQSNTGSAGGSSQAPPTVPINALNPFQNRWVTKGRCVNKSSLRTWVNPKGEGRLFSFDLKDDSGEIRVTAFNEECNRFFDLIEVGKVYTISRGTVKTANRKYSNVPNEYEMSLTRDSQVTEGNDNDSSCPHAAFDFVKLKELESLDENATIDICAVLRSAGEVNTFTSSKNQKEFTKRDLSVVDESEVEVKLTIWGNDALNFDAVEGTPIIVKGARVSTFSGKSLSVSSGSCFLVNPNAPVAISLRGWYDRVKSQLQPQSLTVLKSSADGPLIPLFQGVYECKSSDRPVFFNTKATLVLMLKTNSYNSCGGCKKKVIDMNNGKFRCEKCNKDVDQMVERIIQPCILADFSLEMFGTAFHDEALPLIGLPADNIIDLKKNDTELLADHMLTRIFKTYIFKLKIHKEYYKDEPRIKASILGFSPVDHVAYSQHLMRTIRSMTQSRVKKTEVKK